jgi:hypothetical protein
MPGFMPGIHAFYSLDAVKAWMAPELGLVRVLDNKRLPKSGEPDLGDKPGHDKASASTINLRVNVAEKDIIDKILDKYDSSNPKI